jgi:uncharacterized caspase-like protein
MLHVIAIGIDTYADPQIRGLSYAAGDALAVASLFERRTRPEECRVLVRTNEEATRDTIMDLVGRELMEAAEPEDNVLIYFACHGCPEMTTRLDRVRSYLVTADTRHDRIYATGIDLERDVSGWCERLDCQLTVIIFDTCFSGAAGGRTFLGPGMTARPGLRDGEVDLRPSLRDLRLGRGKVLLSACDDDQVAFESPELGHGVFTYHLLQQLNGTPTEQAPTIGIGALYERLLQAVEVASDGRQSPTIKGAWKGAALPILR